MDIQRMDSYTDPRFLQEVLYQHGALCVLDGHTRLYEAWRQGIYHVRDMALYSPQEQKKNWYDWCDAYFAAQEKAEPTDGRNDP